MTPGGKRLPPPSTDDVLARRFDPPADHTGTTSHTSHTRETSGTGETGQTGATVHTLPTSPTDETPHTAYTAPTPPTSETGATSHTRATPARGGRGEPAGMVRKTYYMSRRTADELEAAVDQLHHGSRGVVSKHEALAAIIEAGLGHLDAIAVRLLPAHRR